MKLNGMTIEENLQAAWFAANEGEALDFAQKFAKGLGVTTDKMFATLTNLHLVCASDESVIRPSDLGD